MSLEFLDDGAIAIYQPGNGNTIRYKRAMGIYFHEETSPEIVQALNYARCSIPQIRVRIFQGDTQTGKSWLEEHHNEGYIGSSMGPLKIPLLIYNCRTMGGPGILDHCIVKIITTRSKRVLYQHPSYHTGEFTLREISPDEIVSWHTTKPPQSLLSLGYSYAVDVNGENQASFKTLKEAQRYITKMTA